jgi:hypothetical protein
MCNLALNVDIDVVQVFGEIEGDAAVAALSARLVPHPRP